MFITARKGMAGTNAVDAISAAAPSHDNMTTQSRLKEGATNADRSQIKPGSRWATGHSDAGRHRGVSSDSPKHQPMRKKKRRLPLARALPMVPAGIFEPPGSSSGEDPVAIDLDEIDDSHLLLPPARRRLKAMESKLQDIAMNVQRPTSPKRRFPRFLAPHNGPKRRFGDGFVGPELTRPSREKRRLRANQPRAELIQMLPLRPCSWTPVEATVEPVMLDDCDMAGNQLTPPAAAELHAMTAIYTANEYVPDTILPNKVPQSQLSAAWGDFHLEPKLSARQNWENQLSDDVFYQLAAVKAPLRLESDSDESELSDDDSTASRFNDV